MKELVTFAGVPIDDTLWNELAHMYGASAYSAVGGATYLTDVNNGQVMRRMYRVFGPRGLGWGLEINNLDIQMRDVVVKDKPQHEAIIMAGKFWYAFREGEGKLEKAYIGTAGSSVNREAGHALTGAMTGCIKKAISYLGHQNALYCGLVDHKTVGSFPKDGAYLKPKDSRTPATGEPEQKTLLETAKELGGKEI